MAISKNCLQHFHPHNALQWSAELGKSNGWEHWASADNAVVRIKVARVLRRVEVLMNKARRHLWTTLVQDLPAMCAFAYHQLLNQQGGAYDHRVDAFTWDGMNSAPLFVQMRESTAYAGVLLDTDGSMKWHRQKSRHSGITLLLFILHDVKCSSRCQMSPGDHIPYFRMKLST